MPGHQVLIKLTYIIGGCTFCAGLCPAISEPHEPCGINHQLVFPAPASSRFGSPGESLGLSGVRLLVKGRGRGPLPMQAVGMLWSGVPRACLRGFAGYRTVTVFRFQCNLLGFTAIRCDAQMASHSILSKSASLTRLPAHRRELE